jgi:phosphoglycolate phosphatase-like HAD superfamily hydrolase
VAFCGVAWGINPSALRAAEPERVIERPEDLLPLVRGDQAGRSPAPSSA